jgi:hypothetical protein
MRNQPCLVPLAAQLHHGAERRAGERAGDAGILPEDRQLLVELLRTIKNAVPADAPTTPILEYVSDVLRAKYAKVIEAE